jgi:hypothetical protein
VLVSPMKDMDGLEKGNQYYGYYIMYQMDICHIMDDPSVKFYKARVCSSELCLLEQERRQKKEGRREDLR